jgi:hypothetical protein
MLPGDPGLPDKQDSLQRQPVGQPLPAWKGKAPLHRRWKSAAAIWLAVYPRLGVSSDELGNRELAVAASHPRP